MKANSYGVIGHGAIAERHRQNIKKLIPNAKVICLSSRGNILNEDPIYSDLQVANIEDLIKYDIKFVVVASPSSLHLEHSKPLIEAKIPILLEKPICSNLQDSKEIISLVNNNATPIAVAYCLRFMPSLNFVKDIISSNKIGPVHSVNIVSGQFLPNWRPTKNYKDSVSANINLGGGVLLELSHEIDYIRFLFGDLNLQFASLRNSKTLSLDVEEIADLTFSNSTNTIFNMHLDFLQDPPERSVRIYGEKGKLNWNLLDNTVHLLSCDGNSIINEDKTWSSNDMYIDMLKDFLLYINDGKHRKLVNIYDAHMTLKSIDEVKRYSNMDIEN